MARTVAVLRRHEGSEESAFVVLRVAFYKLPWIQSSDSTRHKDTCIKIVKSVK